MEVRRQEKALPTDLPTLDIAALRLSVLRLGRRIRQHAGEGVTPSQLSAVATIGRWGPLRLNELARRERIGNSTVTRLVVRLEDAGYVVRQHAPEDRRVVLVSLADKGRRLLEKSQEQADSYLFDQVESLSTDERAALARALPVLERLLEVRA